MSNAVRYFILIFFTVLAGYAGFKLVEYLTIIKDYDEIVKNLKDYTSMMQKVYIYKSQLKQVT